MRSPTLGLAVIALCLAAAPALAWRDEVSPMRDPIVLRLAVNSERPASVKAPAGAPSQGVAALEDMKESYLRCERAALAGALPGEDILACSVIYEELKHVGFDGDAGRLREWSRPLLGLPRLGDE